jgi:hypothetical protein
MNHPPAFLLMAAFSRHAAALDWARQRAEVEWGPVGLASPLFEFSETSYYEPTMGAGLRKVLWVFERPFDASQLATIKRTTIGWEQEFARMAASGDVRDDAGEPIRKPRPVNLDPGYLTTAKLVLASTKDHAHRIYLGDGIFAEITLFFRHGRWEDHEWTFPDYRRADYQTFFSQSREHLKAHCASTGERGGQ